MTNNILDEIVTCMALHNGNSDLQAIQTEHRLKLVQFWKIEEGSRVLEIGCGQGDTTAVLAHFVGETGHVHGIDIASPNYGAPITLAQAAEHLKKSKFGNRISFDFETDVLSDEVDFKENEFDYIVFSQCSWYFKSSETFLETLKKIRKWGKKLCFAEWDVRINHSSQLAHYMAVIIQAQYECFKENSHSNVRTLFSANEIKTIAESASWEILKETSIYSSDMHDGKWETDMVRHVYKNELESLKNVPVKFKNLIRTELNLMEESIKNNGLSPMSVFAFLAKQI